MYNQPRDRLQSVLDLLYTRYTSDEISKSISPSSFRRVTLHGSSFGSVEVKLNDVIVTEEGVRVETDSFHPAFDGCFWFVNGGTSAIDPGLSIIFGLVLETAIDDALRVI